MADQPETQVFLYAAKALLYSLERVKFSEEEFDRLDECIDELSDRVRDARRRNAT